MTMPPLPDPCCWGYDVPDAPLPHGRGLFNADQMREYGATCAAAERERIALWLKDNYQDYATVAGVADAIRGQS